MKKRPRQMETSAVGSAERTAAAITTVQSTVLAPLRLFSATVTGWSAGLKTTVNSRSLGTLRCGRRSQQFVEGFHEKVLAPHDAFIDAEVLPFVVAAVLEDAFPSRRVHREELCG